MFQSVFLGVIQGLTEFLPVSSSGHLVLAQKLLPGFSQPGVLFDVILHFGTLFAVLIYFRSKIIKLSIRYIYLIILATLPAVLLGLIFQKQFENMFLRDKYLGLELIITGVLNLLVDIKPVRKTILNTKNSVLIGIAQAISIVPGISRSGATIFTGVKLGIDKKTAAEFSFLLSVPAILGANFVEIISYKSDFVSGLYTNYFWGFVAALIVGFLSIGLVFRFLEKNKFKYFGYYCLTLGILISVFI